MLRYGLLCIFLHLPFSSLFPCLIAYLLVYILRTRRDILERVLELIHGVLLQ